MTTEAAADSGEFDMEGAVADLGEDLFGAAPAAEDDLPPEDDTPPEADDKPAEPPATEAPPPAGKAAPASWKKEMHEKWASLPPDVQEYIEAREGQMQRGDETYQQDAKLGRTMRDVMTPYRAMLSAQGIDEPRAVQALLNAHYRLSNLPPSEKSAYFATLAQQYGIDLAGVKPAGEEAPVDPAIRQVMQELNGIKSHLTAAQQQTVTQTRERITREIEAFASDPAHTHFDEVSAEMVAFLQAGYELKDAYDRAVWSNPVVRAKEVARLQTEAAKADAEKREKELAAVKAATSNTVRNRDSRRTPTETKGSMRDLDASMRETLREIKQRAH